ncbi:DNA adenine methylase [Peristeroidobacter soli]|uniref:DNA adenine methylase n=1 Tax=Peristeroidobacter soli TaxID=2497877 RepID=UPI00101CF142
MPQTARVSGVRSRTLNSDSPADAVGVAGQLPSVTPILRWAGSKRKILPVLADFWKPSYRRYVEPFAGSAALFFKLQPEKALLGDINSALMEAYEVIRERPDDVHRAVSAIERTEREYYRVRDRSSSRLKAFGRAVRFVYLNRYCFNGIYRTNRDGHFNVPFAHKKPGVIPPIEDFRRSAALLQSAALKAGDFGEVLSAVQANDFVYVDPPYAVESRRVFREYDRREFSKRDLERLAAHLSTMDRKGAAFVVSYADCREARELFSRWSIRRIAVRRHIAGFVSARRNAIELLVTNT